MVRPELAPRIAGVTDLRRPGLLVANWEPGPRRGKCSTENWPIMASNPASCPDMRPGRPGVSGGPGPAEGAVLAVAALGEAGLPGGLGCAHQ